LKWDDVPHVWQTCFRLAWDAHLEGSNPIGALIANADGDIVATGKSAVGAELSEVHVSHCEIAHAEVNALLALDNRIHNKAKASKYTLFVTLEPCPLCFAALYMSDVKNVCFAAKDRYGGSTNLLGTTPYLSRKTINVKGPYDTLGEISVFLNVYCDILRGDAIPSIVHDELEKDYEGVVQRARIHAVGDSLRIGNQRDFSETYEIVRAAISA